MKKLLASLASGRGVISKEGCLLAATTLISGLLGAVSLFLPLLFFWVANTSCASGLVSRVPPTITVNDCVGLERACRNPLKGCLG